MKNTTFFTILGFLTVFIPMETQANNNVQHERTEKSIFSNNKTTLYMKTGTLSDLIELLSSYGKPKTQEQIDNWREFGKTFDLYRSLSDQPLTKKMLCYIYDKERETEENQKELKNLELVCSGEQFIEVMLNVFEQVKKPSIKFFVEALNFYVEHNTFMKMKP